MFRSLGASVIGEDACDEGRALIMALEQAPSLDRLMGLMTASD